jgi:hypothetical protein
MTKAQLRKLLAENGQKLLPGYNYAMLSVSLPAAEVAATVALLRRNKARIEREYAKDIKRTGYAGPNLRRIKLLPFVCLPRKRSVLVPVPHGCCINVVSGVIAGLPGICENAGFPLWA